MDLNTALCSGAGAIVAAGLGFLAQKLGINDKIIAAIKGAKGNTVIKGHPLETEALDALEQAGLGVMQDLVAKHPDVLTVIEDKLSHDSLTNVGAYLAANYGPEIVADTIARGEALVGTELKIIFGGQKAVEEAAILRLGCAASCNLPSLKSVVKLPSGATLVLPS